MSQWRMLTPEQIADVAIRLSTLGWSWSVADVDAVAARLGWPEKSRHIADAEALSATLGHPIDPASVGGFLQLSTGYPAESGIAIVNLEGSVADSISVTATSRIEPRFPERVDAFAAVVSAVVAALGRPVGFRPGKHPGVAWPAADGVLGIDDNGAYVDLELRSAAFQARLAASDQRLLEERRFKALNPPGEDDENDILSTRLY